MYNLEYHKYLDRSHILPNLLNGAIQGVIAQFLSDLIITFLLEEGKILINDVNISNISQYYASVASGMVAAVLLIFLDPFAVVLFSTISYNYVYLLVENDFNINFEIDTEEIIEDSIETILLLFMFDPVAKSQYLRYTEKRHNVEPDIPRRDRTTMQLIFFVILTNTYNFFTEANN